MKSLNDNSHKLNTCFRDENLLNTYSHLEEIEFDDYDSLKINKNKITTLNVSNVSKIKQ